MANIHNLSRAGRKPGARNRATIAREALQAEAIKLLAKEIGRDEVTALSPLDVLLACMHAAFRAGDLAGARVAAEAAAPFCHARKSPASGDNLGLPPELQPDPPSEPDDPDAPSVIE